MSSGLTVGRLGRDDVDGALALSRDAGWPTRRADWQRMVSLDSVDPLGGRIGGELVATATVVRYGDRVAWIGMMLVAPSRRRRGHGTELLEACLERVDRAGVDVAGLDANPVGKPLYDGHGFVPVVETTQWRGRLPATRRPASVEPFDDPGAVAALDRRASGVDRSFLLRSLLADAETAGLLARDGGDVRGYALLRPGDETRTVGPLVVETPSVADALLRAAGAAVGDDPVTVNVPGNSTATDRYEDLGLEHRRSLTRMTHRARAEPLTSDRIWGIPSFAYG